MREEVGQGLQKHSFSSPQQILPCVVVLHRLSQEKDMTEQATVVLCQTVAKFNSFLMSVGIHTSQLLFPPAPPQTHTISMQILIPTLLEDLAKTEPKSYVAHLLVSCIIFISWPSFDFNLNFGR
jgi:hypothetical protein